MNAAPISINAANSANAGDASSAQAGKSSALPAFAQVLADKQSSASAPNTNPSPTTAAAKNSTTPADAASSQSPKTTPSPARSNSQAKPAAPAQPSAPAAPKKADPKAKLSTDSEAKQTAATAAAAGATAAMLALTPAVNPVAIRVMPSDPKIAVPSADASLVQGSSTPPPAAENAAPATHAQPQPLSQANSIPLQSLAALPDIPLPHLSAGAVDPSQPLANATSAADPQHSPSSNNSAPPAPLASNAMPSANPTTSQAAPAASLNPNAQALQPPSSSDAQPIPAAIPEAATPVAKNGAGDPAKAQIASSGNHKSTVSDLLHDLASAAGKTVETVAHVTATAARDVASASKEKASTNGTSLPSAALSNTAAKAQQSSSVKQEPAATSPQTPAKINPSKNAGNSNDTADNNDASSAASDNPASTEANSKAKAFTVEAASSPSVQPSQAAAANSVSVTAAGLSSLPAKEPSIDIKPAAAAQETIPAAPPDPDDAKLPSFDSKVLNVSQLTGNDAHSEVRIAMQADQLGQVELHATLNGQQVGAAITVEKKEAHAAMAVELPSLQQALEEKNLRVSEVVLSQSAMHSTSGDASRGGNAPTEQRQNPIGRQYQLSGPENNYPAPAGAILETAGIFDGYGRLSVRV